MAKKNESVASSTVTKQTAAMIAFAAFIAGFLGGAAFAVFKMPSPSFSSSQISPGGSAPNSGRQINALEAEVLRNPENAGAWVQLGHAYFDSGNPPKAIHAYEKALSLKPGDANVLTDLGIMHRRNGDPEKAIEAFNRAVEADPKHQNARFNKGIVYMHDLNDPEKAIRAWEELLEINPLAMAGNGQSVDQLVDHYKKHVRKTPD